MKYLMVAVTLFTCTGCNSFPRSTISVGDRQECLSYSPSSNRPLFPLKTASDRGTGARWKATKLAKF